MLHRLKRLARDLVSPVARRVAPVRWKELNELQYWRTRRRVEGTLANDHYQQFYTTHFGLAASDYAGKVILDIGCGPRGSLEWATQATRRIGLDPLSAQYLKLGARHHSMEYIAAAAERIPLVNASCDAVFSFNSLDHVEDVERTLSEIARVTRAGGQFLVLVEVNHPPTDSEPHCLSAPRLIDALQAYFVCERMQLYQKASNDMYGCILAGLRLPSSAVVPAFLSARFRRI